MKHLCFFLPILAFGQPTVRTVCASGCDYTTLAAAITAAASAGCSPQVIELASGETFDVGDTVPYSGVCNAPWTIRSSRWRDLAARRVGPADAGLMAKLRNASGTTAALEIRRNNVTVEGLEIQHNPGSSLSLYGIMNIGQFTGGNYCDGTPAKCPRGVRIRRSYIHGNSQQDGLVRAVQVSGYDVLVEDSYIDEAKSTLTDSQGVACSFSNCWGLRIVNTFVRAAAENVYIGGGANSGQSWHPSPGEAPRGLWLAGSHLTKKPEWLRYSGAGAPSGACLSGSLWLNTSSSAWYLCTDSAWGGSGSGAAVANYIVKNLYEQKDGQGSYILGTVMENSWQAAQSGFAFLLNQTSGDTTLTSNVKAGTLDYNITDFRVRGVVVRRVATGLSIGALDTPLLRTRPQRLRLEHSNWEVGGNYLRTQATIPKIFVLNTLCSVVIAHNTAVPNEYVHTIFISNDDVHSGFRCSSGVWNNVLGSVDWVTPGLFGSWLGVLGSRTTIMQSSAYVSAGAWFDWRRNAVGGPGSITTGPGNTWPADHVTASTLAGLLTDPASGDYSALVGGPAKGAAPDGSDLGADQALIATLTAGATSGARNPALFAGIRAARAAGTTVTVRYVAPSGDACTVTAAATEAFSSIGSGSQTRLGRGGVATITGASEARFVRVTCGAWHEERVL